MDLIAGILLTIVAGALAGNCMLPMKFVRRWKWENVWLAFTLVSLLILPWALAFLLVRDLPAVYAALSPSDWLAPVAFGAGWGVAQVLFGLSIARLGLALGYAIIIGLGALFGTLVPLLAQDPGVLRTGRGALIAAGVLVMLAGIGVSALAGRSRERQGGAAHDPGNSRYGAAVTLAIVCGLLAPMINYSFAFGQGIAEEAVRQGSTARDASYAVWPVGLLGGLVPNLAYSVWLLNRNGTWSLFTPATADLRAASLMGALWMGSMACYGLAAGFLGRLGTSVGWALFQIFMIMTANLSGVLTGEWKGASAGARRLLWSALALLILATVVLSAGNAGAGGR